MAGLSRSALLTIDVQGDFYERDAPAQVEGTRERLPEMQNVVQAFRSTGRPIVHVVRLYLADGSNAEPVRRPLLTTTPVVRPGTAGSQVAPELLPKDARQLDSDLLLAGEFQSVGPSEWVMYKPRWGAFYGTRLEDLLRHLAVDTVVLVGCNFPNCPRTTLYEASERDFDAVLVSDAVSGTYERGLREVCAIGAMVMTGSEVSDLVMQPCL
ncbi:MAG TPA: cysteine hydrolase [Acidimicrobiales bacterium]|nr:cysteine hydrolase [Acidimicrobiales bacterium]